MKRIIFAGIITALVIVGFSGCSNAPAEENQTQFSLSSKTWAWAGSNNPGVFTLTFNEDGRVSVGTDCNNMGGQYTAKDGSLVFSEMMSTLMYCEGSQEQEFSTFLGLVTGYRFTEEGNLVLSSEIDKDLMTFR